MNYDWHHHRSNFQSHLGQPHIELVVDVAIQNKVNCLISRRGCTINTVGSLKSRLWAVWRRLVVRKAIIALYVLTSALKGQF